MHIMKTFIDFRKLASVGHVLVDFEFVVEIVFNETRKLSASLDATERGTPPDATGYQLERPSADLLSGCCNTDDGGDAPTLVACLEGCPHHFHIASRVKGEIETAVCNLDEVILDALAPRQGHWVDEVGRAHLFCPFFFLRIHVYGDYTRCANHRCSGNNSETDSTTPEDGNTRALDSWLFGNSTPGGSDTAAKQADLIQGCGFIDGDDRDVGNDCVLRERRSSHEMVDGLSPAGEAGGPVGHQTLSLCGTDFSTEIGLAALAELAFTAFRRIQGNDVVARGNICDTFADGLDDTAPFVTKDHREDTLGIPATASIFVRVANTSVDNLDADLVRPWRSDLYLLDLEFFACRPADGSFALDNLTYGGDHDDEN